MSLASLLLTMLTQVGTRAGDIGVVRNPIKTFGSFQGSSTQARRRLGEWQCPGSKIQLDGRPPG